MSVARQGRDRAERGRGRQREREADRERDGAAARRILTAPYAERDLLGASVRVKVNMRRTLETGMKECGDDECHYQ